MIVTGIILLLSVIFFVNGKVRSDVVALCALIALLLCDILTPAEALSGFSNSVVIMMVGLFVVGGAIFQTGLAKIISSRILKLAGKSEMRLFILVMLVTSAIGGFVSNTGTVALLLPIVVSLAMSVDVNPGRFLMPLAFASSMGGMMTLIGTPPNLIIHSTLLDAGYEGLSFFSFLPVGLICVSVGLVVLIPMSKIFLSKGKDADNKNKNNRKTLKELVKEYGVSNNLSLLKVVDSSKILGKSIAQLNLRSDYGLNVFEVRRKETAQNRFLKVVTQQMADPETIIENGDTLYITGEYVSVLKFAKDNALEVVRDDAYKKSGGKPTLDFYDIGVAEVVVMQSSSLINSTIRESEFRAKYNLNVLGIRRKTNYILKDFADERIHTGDVLLVQGSWENIARLGNEENDWVVLGRPLEEAAKVTLDYKAPVAAAIMLLMIAMMFASRASQIMLSGWKRSSPWSYHLFGPNTLIELMCIQSL